MRQCPKCGEWKDEEEFAWQYKSRNIRQAVCRSCRSDENAAWYETNKKEQKERSHEHKRDAIEAAQRYVYEYLSYARCADCGEFDFAVLTFHHVRGKKKMDVSQMAAQSYSIEAIQQEINKGVVVCFNYHMRRENEDRSAGRFRRFWPKMPWEE